MDPRILDGSSRRLHSSLLVGYAHHGHAKATVIRCRHAGSDAWSPRPGQSPGLHPFLSRALIAAISEAAPSMRGIPSHETVSVINGQGLAEEYADLISGFIRSGILERERLQRIGSALGSRYVLLPGLADFNQVVIDKFEIAGIKMVRNRVITLRLWLQLWDTQTGEIVWESAGEATVASELLLPQRMVPLDEIGQKLWLRMVQDNLLTGETQSRFFNN
jgi:hypothetical protein